MFRRRNDPPESPRRPVDARESEARAPEGAPAVRFNPNVARPGPLEPAEPRLRTAPPRQPAPIPTPPQPGLASPSAGFTPAAPANPSPSPANPSPTPGQPVTMSTSTSPAAPAAQADEKRLTVGRNICLSGQITACDKLVVEGTVDATLSESRMIEIGQSGIFRGAAEIDEAEIAGQFEGTLTVRGRLFIRSTGRVKGEVRYGQLEIELGGVLTGTLESVGRDAAKPAEAARKVEAPRPQPVQEEAV